MSSVYEIVDFMILMNPAVYTGCCLNTQCIASVVFSHVDLCSSRVLRKESFVNI
jgi:hypothetical protein